MNKRIKKIILFFGIIFGFFGVPFGSSSFVSALEISYPTILGHTLNSTSSLGDFLCYFFSVGTFLSFTVVSMVVVAGGIIYLISYGRGKFTDEGKSWVKAGLLGFLLVLCSSLIIYNINPTLTTCKLGFLPQINLGPLSGFNSNSASQNLPTTSYNEIPIGILTENLLTRTMPSCYGFDQNGNPIYNQITTDNSQTINNGPTYINHDRADCLSQLVNGAQKKGLVVASLADEVNKLMNQCNCSEYGNCKPACNSATGCQPTGCPANTSNGKNPCGGPCVNGACNLPPSGGDCCPSGVKNKIEHGPISATVNFDTNAGASGSGNCTTQATYKGLDEFRCPNANQCTGSYIVSFVEKTQSVKLNGETVTITVINKANWDKLTLLQQLTYFAQKIATWPADSGIKADKNLLDQAKSTLSSCYLVEPYIDLVKKYESTDEKQNIILINKTLKDPLNGYPINIAKYCQGFNYNNSSCLEKCSNMCPDTGSAVMALYKNCGTCKNGDQACLSNQETCIENAYNSRLCIYGTNTSQTFNAAGDSNSCISSCQKDCSTACAEKYPKCSSDYTFCQSQCANNSSCVLNNASSCLLGSQKIGNCANQATDQGNANFCINNSYLCKNGSDEYAGYQDCAEPSTVNMACSSFIDKKTCEAAFGCAWNNNKCSQNYSGSFLYDNPNNQKCPNPYVPPAAGTSCYNIKAGPTTSCQNLCPETTKCVSSSQCPNCSCDQLNQTFNFSVPNNSTNSNAGNEGYNVQSQNVSSDELVGPQCNQYSYNDDPLTFYCENSPEWYSDQNNPGKQQGNNKNPQGSSLICPKSGEIPVGQTVDNAENWATWIMNSENKIDNDIFQMVGMMTLIGNAKSTSPIQNYCKCNAKYTDNKPVCVTSCQYIQTTIGGKGGGGGGGGGGGINISPNDIFNGANNFINNASNFFGGSYNYVPSPLSINDNNFINNTKAGMAVASLINSNQISTAQYNNANTDKILLAQDDQTQEFTDQGGGGGSTGGGTNNSITPNSSSNSGSKNKSTANNSSNGKKYSCSCKFVPCQGSPCQMLIDYQSQLWNNYKSFDSDFINFYTSMLKEPRSDIMKELAYSRTTTNSCSLVGSSSGTSESLLDCTRVEDGQISPVSTSQITFNGKTFSGYCYGTLLGKDSTPPSPLTDNWFCCQQFQH